MVAAQLGEGLTAKDLEQPAAEEIDGEELERLSTLNGSAIARTEDIEEAETPLITLPSVALANAEAATEPDRFDTGESSAEASSAEVTTIEAAETDTTSTPAPKIEASNTEDKAEANETEPAATEDTYKSLMSELEPCIVCQDLIQLTNTPAITCGHTYCGSCLRDLFSACLTDEALFPPRCCRQPIDLEAVKDFLTPELVEQFERKRVEFSTKDRTYCSNAQCSIFLDPWEEGFDAATNKATCSACRTITCTLCKAAAHDGDCPADTGLQQVLDTARENGWQRCPSCRRIIELDVGCHHITYVSLFPPDQSVSFSNHCMAD
jgi:hypothetical protein